MRITSRIAACARHGLLSQPEVGSVEADPVLNSSLIVST